MMSRAGSDTYRESSCWRTGGSSDVVLLDSRTPGQLQLLDVVDVLDFGSLFAE